MFRKKWNLSVLFGVIFFVSVFMLIANVITGRASSISGNKDQGGAGLINVSSLEMSIEGYDLIDDDLTRIKSIRFEVYDDQVDEDTNILVSVDSGNSWVACKNSEAAIWICTFSESNAPMVIDLQTVEVVING